MRKRCGEELRRQAMGMDEIGREKTWRRTEKTSYELR